VILPFEIIKYFVHAKGRHGIHSPFVYDFVDKCLKIQLNPEFIQKRNELFSKLKESKESISVADFGVGSKKLTNSREIKSLFKVSSTKGKYADLLFRISSFYKPAKILELGTSLGIGTIHLQAGNPKANSTTIDACGETINQAKLNFSTFNFEINCVNETFNNYLDQLQPEKFDLIFIDGHHDGQALKNYLEKLHDYAHDETIFILDDIRWSASMFHAWNEIIQSEKYHVTLDLFRIGIVISKKQQTKQHFVIRY
jgi:predicted O-methyltransferase YrrM